MQVRAGVNPALVKFIRVLACKSGRVQPSYSRVLKCINKQSPNLENLIMNKVENVKEELGFCELFADRDTCKEAQEYLNMVAQGSENPIAVITAGMVLANTMIKVISEKYDLIRKEGTNEQ